MLKKGLSMRETLFYEKLPRMAVRCRTCAHFCERLPGQWGRCGIRQNIDGKMIVLNYGRIISAAADPIEKKPLFHFLPGTKTFSIAAAGCNFSCRYCQNWQISQVRDLAKDPSRINSFWGEPADPAQIVTEAIKYNCHSLSYTYTEPTIFVEFALAVMKAARAKGLKNCWVSNGFMSAETRAAILPYLDAINIDLKFFDDRKYQQICGARLNPVLENIAVLKTAGVWVELTTLVVPGQNDDPTQLRKMAEFIAKKVGPATPWHLSRFSPEISYRLQDGTTTPSQTIIKGIAIGQQAGLAYVYGGNLPGYQLEDTLCPHCRKTLVVRRGFSSDFPYGKAKKCPNCQAKTDLIWA